MACWASAVCWAGTANATAKEGDTALALDLHYIGPVSPDLNVTGGAGAALRLGKRFYSDDWVITLELMGAYDSFGGNDEARLYSGLAGLRVGYDLPLLRPGIFAHAGLGRSSFDDLAAPGLGHTAFTYDAGVFVDLTLLPMLNVGAHAAYNQILESNAGSNGLKWLSVGLHAELVFSFL